MLQYLFGDSALRKACIGHVLRHGGNRQDGEDVFQEAIILFDRKLRFGAFRGEQLVGAVALQCSVRPKTRHAALLVGMYVRPAARQQGVGRRLLQAAIAAATARPQLRLLQLTVTDGNEPARRLYEAAGFVAWGIEPMAVRTPEGFAGKAHMSLRLHVNDAAA